MENEKSTLAAELRNKWDQDLLAEYASLREQVMSIWGSVDVGAELSVNLEYMLSDIEATMECYAEEIQARGLK